MDREFLTQYASEQISLAEAAYQNAKLIEGDLVDKLRCLYDAPPTDRYCYCEAGDRSDLLGHPVQETLVFQFAAPNAETFKSLYFDPSYLVDRFHEQQRRFVAVIQHPLYYENHHFMLPIFERMKPVSYFIRGQYAYALLLGKDVGMIERDGQLVHPEIGRLMDHCESTHSNWLRNAMFDSDCWEANYRKNYHGHDALSPTVLKRLKTSFCYRYASVAALLGKDLVDYLIERLSLKDSAKALLHLHILFDHYLCHGFGSPVSHRLGSAGGQDAVGITSDIWTKTESLLLKKTIVPLFTHPDDRDLFRSEGGVLEGINPEKLKLEDVEEVSAMISSRIVAWNRAISRKEEKLKGKVLRFGCSCAIRFAEPIIGNLLPDAVSSNAMGGELISLPEDATDRIGQIVSSLYRRNFMRFVTTLQWK